MEYALRHVERMVRDGIAWMDVRPEPMSEYNEEIQEAIGGVRVWQAGCNGYYRTPSGRVVTQWPYSMSEFDRRSRDEAGEGEIFEVAFR